ncbi:LysR substrate-binding domain-containing protein [Nocardia tengchongensis]|uniref:LysR substrate-binding domain-containing protein n=1 Tax=Nocardia tengchongensis TaxID=2055889 RepID=UPI00369C094E
MFPPNAQNPDGVSDDKADLDRCEIAGHSRASSVHSPFKTSDRSGLPRVEVRCRQLQYFIAVAEELSFTRAAERLHVSQQGLSTQIKQLEHETDVRLFSRTTRQVELTAAGAAFLRHVRDAMTSLGSGLEEARAIHRGEHGRLVLGCLEGAALTLTEPILAAFRKHHPGVSLELNHFTYETPSAGLANGQSDVAFVRRPFNDTGLQFEPLFRQPLMVMLPTNHRLADRDQVVVAELLDEPILSSAATDPIWNAFWQLDSHRAGRRAQVACRTKTLLEQLQQVATGTAIAMTVPCAAWIKFPGVGLVPVTDAAPNEVAVSWRAGHENPLVRSFVDIARRVRDANPALLARLETPRRRDRQHTRASATISG